MSHMRRSTVRLIIALVFYFCYLLLGAAIFLRIERPKEERGKEALKRVYQDFLFDNRNCMTEPELDDFVNKIYISNDRGVRETVFSDIKTQPRWNFGHGILFAASTLTTIGYGHMARLSRWGKVFCILYVLIGIPYTLILLTALLERLGNGTNRLLKWLSKKYGHKYQPHKIRLMHLGLLILFVLFVFFIVPALVFSAIEHWSYLDSLYYCFISLTTIGYGDYLPGEAPVQRMRALYKVLVAIFLLIGLLFMALLLSIAYEIPQLNLSHKLMEGSDDNDAERANINSPTGGTKNSDPNEPQYVRHVDEESPGSTNPYRGDIKALHQ